MSNPEAAARPVTRTATTRAAPGNHVRPTAVFVLAFAAGQVFQLMAPIHVSVTPAAADALTWAGAALLTAGALLTVHCLALFVRRSTGLMPDRPARCVVTSGPYAWSRNPMFLGFALMYAGAALVLPSVWALLLLPAAMAFTTSTVITREEAYMRATFGSEFERYAARVRRWFGRRT